MKASYRFLDTITAIFVAVLLISNIASAAKIVDWCVLLGLQLAFDAGCCSSRSLHLWRHLDRGLWLPLQRKVIWTGFGLSALMALFSG
jgi:hypothetical protein